MGKRITNAFARDKGQASAGSQEQIDDPNKPPGKSVHIDDSNKPPDSHITKQRRYHARRSTLRNPFAKMREENCANSDTVKDDATEPYLCTGHFQADFTELCKRAQLAVIPPVVLRPQRPASPPPVHVEETKSKPGKGADKKKQAEQPPPDPDAEQELDENGEPPEQPPKTYTTKEKFEYFKPCVQVEMDNPDKQETVTEVIIKGWKIDVPMMDIFKECWTKMDRLHTINLWHTGLTAETLLLMSRFLPECTNLKNLTLDNNPVKEENYHIFLREECPVEHLSLRYNAITDKGVEEMSKLLTNQNSKLISLNLNGNKVTDTGAQHFATALRMNRSLLSLSLANNFIGDKGAKMLADVLSRFPLTHAEVVERRKLFSEKGQAEGKSVSPLPGSRRADSRDRPGSNKSLHGTKGGKSAKTKKTDTKGKDDEKAKTKGKEDKTKKGGNAATSGRNSGASMVNDTKKKGQTKGKTKGGSNHEIESTLQVGTNEASDSSDLDHPLMDSVERLPNGTLLIAGNRSLINLNLSSNQIGEEGLKELLLAMKYQTTMASFSQNKPGSTGLLRLVVNRNKVERSNEVLNKLTSLMITKDPYYKAPSSPDVASQVSKS